MSYVCETKSDDLQHNRYLWYMWYFFRGTCGTCGTSMGTSGTSGTRGTSGKQHTDIASHVIHPDPVRNKIRIQIQPCIYLVHKKTPTSLSGFLLFNYYYYYSFTSTSMSSYTSFNSFISFSSVIKLNISCSISSKVLPSSLLYVIWLSTSFSQNISFCNM